MKAKSHFIKLLVPLFFLLAGTNSQAEHSVFKDRCFNVIKELNSKDITNNKFYILHRGKFTTFPNMFMSENKSFCVLSIFKTSFELSSKTIPKGKYCFETNTSQLRAILLFNDKNNLNNLSFRIQCGYSTKKSSNPSLILYNYDKEDKVALLKLMEVIKKQLKGYFY